MTIRSLIFALICLSSVPAFAGYYSVLDTGEVMKEGNYKITGDAQILTKNGGLNVGGAFDMGFQEEFGLRGLFGFGKTDVFAGAMFKWMPIPDIENQPAIGANVGIIYGKDGDTTDMTIRLEPLVSKKIHIDQTTMTPYASLPVGVRIRNTSDYYVNDDTKMTFQLVVGTQLQIEQWKNLQFMGEIGLDLDQAPAYLSLAGIFYFDSESGFSLQ